MDTRTRSPQRQHILSSINPEREAEREHSPKRRRGKEKSSRSPRTKEEDDSHSQRNDAENETRSRRRERSSRSPSIKQEDESHPRRDDPEDKTRPRRSRLKLKDEKSRRRHRRHHSKSPSRSSRHDKSRSRSRSPSSRSRRHRHHDHSPSSRRHRRRRREHRSPTPPNPHVSPPLDPEAAFRASLFDAMADDEGATYWEGVYGQPIHIYEDEYSAANQNGGEGSLERMSEEEYAAYVRQRMWEKTNAGLLEEKARREQMKKEKEAKKRREKELHDEVMRNAQREDEQRFKRRWEKRFAEYVNRWADVPTSTTTSSSSRPRPSPETILPWPVDSGRREDICESAVRSFFLRGLNAAEMGETRLAAALKEERVRWHPDKIQQRLGGEVDEVVMRDVTAIFQTVDTMWSEVRGKKL